jgi:hypothetical protein
LGRFAVHCKRQHVGYVVNVHRYSAQQYLCPDCFGKRQRPDFAIQLYVVQRQTDGVLGVVQPRYALVARHAAGKQQRGFTRGRLWSRGGRHIVRRQTTALQRWRRSRRHDVGQRRGFDGGGGGDRGGRGGRWLPSSASSALAVARAWGGGGGDVVDVHAPPPIALVLKRHGALTTGAGEFGRGLGGQRALHHFGVPARGGGHRVRRPTLSSGALCRGQGRSTRSTGGHLIFSGGPATKRSREDILGTFVPRRVLKTQTHFGPNGHVGGTGGLVRVAAAARSRHRRLSVRTGGPGISDWQGSGSIFVFSTDRTHVK